MLYLLKSKKENRHKLIKWLIPVVFVCLIFVLDALNQRIFPRLFYSIAGPLWKAKNQIILSADVLFSSLGSRINFQAQKDFLEEKANELSFLTAERDLLERENRELKGLFNIKNDAKNIIGKVFAKPPIVPYDTIMIDVGEKDGVEKGAKIMVQKIVIGEAEEVFSDSSRVTLYGKAGQKLNVFIGPNGFQTEAEGMGSGNFSARVLKNIPLTKGDNVFMANPRKIFLGSISEIFSEEASPFETIMWRIPANALLLKWVEVEV